MDTNLTLTLSISIIINLLTLRWAYREHAARRRYQQETRILRQVLQGVHPDRKNPVVWINYLIFWLLVLVVCSGLIWLVAH